MIFEITILDTTGRHLLRDAFLMESITTLIDFTSDVLRPWSESSVRKAYELSIRSEKDRHVFHRLDSLEAVMSFKNALYEHLVELTETPYWNI
ncbi:hypothetical protein [Pseudozobellia sp. WGM2]|uniref:hypothetical protein n=1 Tax=Pseudozobellia sp. WGM2 TaxID=2787625 RepID=UPI001ADF66D9|nr:hypothetical protein [Pseudozobellia sp. WGM2]